MLAGATAWTILGTIVGLAVWWEHPFTLAPPSSLTDTIVGGLTAALILTFTGGFVGAMLWVVSWSVVKALARRHRGVSQDRTEE
jgi:hypothetical protein